jgi:hypothetical protein
MKSCHSSRGAADIPQFVRVVQSAYKDDDGAIVTGGVARSLPSPTGPSTVLVFVLGAELLWGD